MAQSVVEDRVLLIGDALQEVSVVGDDDESARPGVEEVLHRGEHVRVDVVRRLVEDDDIGFGHEQHQKLEPALLSTGEFLDPGRQMFLCEAEAFEQLSRSEVLALDVE